MLQPLKKKHLARLSPVMHGYGRPFVRPEEFVPITGSMSGIGNYEAAKGTAIDPRGEALWSNLYRIGTAGSLSRVTPFGPAAFSGLGDNGTSVTVPPSESPFLERARDMAPLIVALGATVGLLWLTQR